MSMLEKCKESQPVIQRIIESTTDDEAMLFEALNLHDELQLVISRYEELEAAVQSGEPAPGKSDTPDANLATRVGAHSEPKAADTSEADLPAHDGTHIEPKTLNSAEANLPAHIGVHDKTKAADSPKGEKH